ncbi:MAG: DUF4097 family beta strand repeat-containing protein [Pseudomonadota bacterium]
MNHGLNRHLLPLASLALLPLLAQAETIDQVVPLNADGMAVIKVVKGEVRVTGWDRNEIQIRGDLGEGSDRLLVEGNSQRREIEVRIPRRSRDVEGTELELRVPSGASIAVETTSADIFVDGLAGTLVELKAVSGDIEVEAGGERLFAHTVSGDIEMESTSRRVDINTVSGDVDARANAEEADVNTVSGEVLFISRELARSHIESVSGDMELDLGVAESGSVTIASLSGDVDVILPDDLSATCEAESFSGSIRSAHGEVQKAKYGPHKTLRFVQGSGSGRLRIESFSGDVRIRNH